MSRKPPLRAVTEQDQPAKRLTLVEAVETGNYRLILLAQQREIAATVGEEKGPAKAALHRQLALISKELETLDLADVDGEGSVVATTADEAWDGTGY
jgi:hypothetical protein